MNSPPDARSRDGSDAAPRLHTIFILVDGLGMGVADPAVNPIHEGACPCLESLMARHAVPIDAGLGVPGIPQSATGQTTMLTGVNAQQEMGRHVEGFPGPRLKAIIRRQNIYGLLRERGASATFANAYFVHELDDVRRRRVQSVTTVAALSAFRKVRDRAAMERNEAVYQDITRASLRERGYEGSLVTPEEAAGHLAGIAAEHDFTLFEYFQTDRAGHKGDPGEIAAVLSLLDRFVAGVLPRVREAGWLFVLTSDHGNIEDSRVRSHTDNPVPFVAVGARAEFLLGSVHSLLDVTPAIVGLYRELPC